MQALIDTALRGALIALLAVLALALARDRPGSAAARLGTALCAGLVLYTLHAAPTFEAHAHPLVFVGVTALINGNAVLFWMFSRALLEDDFVPRAVHLAAWGALVLLGGVQCAWLVPARSIAAPAVDATLGTIPLLLGAWVIVSGAARWRADLVESRRQLRAVIVVGGSLYLAGSALARLGSGSGRFDRAASLLDVAALSAITALIAVSLLGLRRLTLFPVGPASADPVASPVAPDPSAIPVTRPAPSAEPGPADPDQDRLAGALDRLMTEQCVYREEGLTITRLAQRLDVPEYRLRRLINGRLGHRNFNAYLNQYRLAEATAALRDPAQAHLPVLSIALTSGFQSIGPFNRAFKASTGLTPTEFRQRHRADSGIG